MINTRKASILAAICTDSLRHDSLRHDSPRHDEEFAQLYVNTYRRLHDDNYWLDDARNVPKTFHTIEMCLTARGGASAIEIDGITMFIGGEKAMIFDFDDLRKLIPELSEIYYDEKDGFAKFDSVQGNAVCIHHYLMSSHRASHRNGNPLDNRRVNLYVRPIQGDPSHRYNMPLLYDSYDMNPDE